MTKAGFIIVDEETTPRLSFTVLAKSAPFDEDMIGYVIFLDVLQEVRIHRIGRDLTLPTATLPGHGVNRASALHKSVKDQFDYVMQQFISMEKTATEHHR